MSEELTDEELNRRVAEVLGWRSGVDAGGTRYLFRPREALGNGTVLDSTLIADGAECRWYGGAGSWFRIPDFSRDPAAADLVRQEMDRRGWSWNTRKAKGGYSAGVHIGNSLRDYHREESPLSPHHALCLAFLAAVDAEKAQEAKP